MEIVVFGAGYVGLVTGAGLASSGNLVTVVEVSEERIKNLRKGILPFFEPGLKELIQGSVKNKSLRFCHSQGTHFEKILEEAEVYFIAVGTPETEDGKTNMTAVDSVVETLCQTHIPLNKKLIAIKSTVPVGTGDEIENCFKKKGKYPVVVSNPEFLKQGNAVQDFLKPERIIVGTEDGRAQKIFEFLYHPFMLKKDRLLVMSRRSAELVKYACNSFLAMKISFINEISQLSEKLGADIRDIRKGMILDSRIGSEFLFPGPGFGGSCFPKDLRSLIHQAKSSALDLKLPFATYEVNQRQRLWAFEKLKKYFGTKLKEKTICLWGLSFKPNTDDMREAPSLPLIQGLIHLGAHVQATDPAAHSKVTEIFSMEIKKGNLRLFDDPYQAAQKADALVLMTEWNVFRTPHFKKLKEIMKNLLIVDARNIYDPEIVRDYGFHYFGVGLPEEKLALVHPKKAIKIS